MLLESRYLVERFRLTAQDVAELDYSVPVYVAAFNDHFAFANHCISALSKAKRHTCAA
jgi:hypothetical protein